MNFFFTGAVRGGRAHQPEYAAIVEELQKHGIVFSSHVSDDTLSHFGETHLSAHDIFHRELEALARADTVVAEITTPSLGVGYLIRAASMQQKKVVALYQGSNTQKLSAIIKGDPRVEIHMYETGNDLQRIFSSLMEKRARD